MKKEPTPEQLDKMTDEEVQALYREAEYKYHSRTLRKERNVFYNYLFSKLELERRGLPTD